MAAAAVFQASAVQLDTLAAELLESFRATDSAWDNDVVTGGRLQLAIERTVDATHANVLAAVTDLQDLALECQRRAVVCAQYSAELATYRDQHRSYQRAYDDWSGDAEARPQDRPSAPRYPTRPAPWVDDSLSNGPTW